MWNILLQLLYFFPHLTNNTFFFLRVFNSIITQISPYRRTINHLFCSVSSNKKHPMFYICCDLCRVFDCVTWWPFHRWWPLGHRHRLWELRSALRLQRAGLWWNLSGWLFLHLLPTPWRPQTRRSEERDGEETGRLPPRQIQTCWTHG